LSSRTEPEDPHNRLGKIPQRHKRVIVWQRLSEEHELLQGLEVLGAYV